MNTKTMLIAALAIFLVAGSPAYADNHEGVETNTAVAVDTDVVDAEATAETSVETGDDDNETEYQGTDNSSAFNINESEATRIARSALSNNSWVLESLSREDDEGVYEFEFAVENPEGEAELKVDASSGDVFELEEEFEEESEDRRDEGDDIEGTDNSTAFDINESEATQIARNALSDNPWVLEEISTEEDEGVYEFEFRFRTNSTEGEAELYVDASSGEVFGLQEEFEEREASEDEELDDLIDDEDYEEAAIVRDTLGARIRALQLDKALQTRIVIGEEVIAYLEAENASSNVKENLTGTLAELEALQEEVAEMVANNESIDATTYVSIKAEARSITADFRARASTYLDEDDKDAVRENAAPRLRALHDAFKDELRVLIREYNANRAQRILGEINGNAPDFVQRIRSGNLTAQEIRAEVRSRVQAAGPGLRGQIQAAIQEERARARVEVRAEAQERVRERLEEIRERQRERTEEARQRIRERIENESDDYDFRVRGRIDAPGLEIRERVRSEDGDMEERVEIRGNGVEIEQRIRDDGERYEYRDNQGNRVEVRRDDGEVRYEYRGPNGERIEVRERINRDNDDRDKQEDEPREEEVEE